MDDKTMYSFGTMKIDGEEQRIVRVKSAEPVDLPAGVYHTTVEKFSDMTVTHDFKVRRSIKTDTDAAGNHYAWYELAEDVKTIDRSPAAASKAAQNAANIDYLSMMSGIDLPDETVSEEGVNNG